MPRTCITVWYVQVYCVLELCENMPYGDVQVHVCVMSRTRVYDVIKYTLGGTSTSTQPM